MINTGSLVSSIVTTHGYKIIFFAENFYIVWSFNSNFQSYSLLEIQSLYILTLLSCSLANLTLLSLVAFFNVWEFSMW